MAKQSTLPGVPGEPKSLGGPVYQGVCAQIRVLQARQPEETAQEWKARKDAVAGWVAQARSLAGSIDRVSGHGATRQASGVQLAALHERLDALLERLDPTGDAVDEFQQLLDRMDRQESNGGAKAPHAEV